MTQATIETIRIGSTLQNKRNLSVEWYEDRLIRITKVDHENHHIDFYCMDTGERYHQVYVRDFLGDFDISIEPDPGDGMTMLRQLLEKLRHDHTDLSRQLQKVAQEIDVVSKAIDVAAKHQPDAC